MRTYPFNLPTTISSFIDRFIPGKLQEAGVWDNLPDDFQKKIVDAEDSGQGLEITQEDLDSLDDDTWNTISELIKPYI